MSHNSQVTSSTNGLTGVLADNPSPTNLPVGEQIFSMCAQYIGAEYAVIAARRKLADDQSIAKNDSVKASLTSGLAAASSTEQMYDKDAKMTRQDAKTQVSSAVAAGAQATVAAGGFAGAVRANSVSSKMDSMSDQLSKINGKSTQTVLSDQDQAAVRPPIDRAAEAQKDQAMKVGNGMDMEKINAGMTEDEHEAGMSLDEMNEGMTVTEKRAGKTLAQKQAENEQVRAQAAQKAAQKQAKDSIIAKYTKRLAETSGGEAAGIRSSHYEKIVGKDKDGNTGGDFNLSELEDGTEHGLAPGETLPKVTLKDVFEAAPTEDDRVALRAGIGRGQRNAMKEANHKNTNVQTAMQIANGVSGAASNSATAQFKMDSANEAEQKGAAARDQALSQAAQQIAQDTSRTQGDTISGANQDVQTAIRSIIEMGQPIHV